MRLDCPCSCTLVGWRAPSAPWPVDQRAVTAFARSLGVRYIPWVSRDRARCDAEDTKFQLAGGKRGRHKVGTNGQ